MNENLPLISIALCTYNGEKYLCEQLGTLVGQTYPNLEIIIVDDASTDQTWAILHEFAECYPSIRLFRNFTNLGYQKNFEKALGLCKGEYILISDQDDIWDKDKVTKLQHAVEDNLLIYHDSAFVDDSGNDLGMKMSDRLHMVEGNDPVPFLFFNCVSGHSMMFRRDLLEFVLPFPDIGVYDHYIAFVASGKGRIKYMPESLVGHRQHSGNSTDILGRKKGKSKLKVTQERMERENNWLKICSETKDHPANKFAKKIYESGKDRTHNFLNFRFGYLIWKYQNKLAYIPKNRSFKTLSFALRQIWGIKAKTLVKRA
ncbi:glycosyltransferase family 2 protein [Lunatibacter salilacus]|uniref:glycosyltransferase family 2 protein n=1 Tax=Lunatibacter salilacus TaxID=2483804 RepID=UPI00131ADDDF|nr:glycosyltransferase family 2 protein [Lunatibacter salilacus]